jgi:hypothetical protein
MQVNLARLEDLPRLAAQHRYKTKNLARALGVSRRCTASFARVGVRHPKGVQRFKRVLFESL